MICLKQDDQFRLMVFYDPSIMEEYYTIVYNEDIIVFQHSNYEIVDIMYEIYIVEA